MAEYNESVNEDNHLKLFQRNKEHSLNKDDLSLKGSIDEPIRSLVSIINQDPFYYTTSTCSGRITLIEKPFGKSGLKKGSTFHLSSHNEVDFEQVSAIIQSSPISTDASDEEKETNGGDKCLWFKFEPFIMHVQCYNLEKASILLNLALAAGCRNSGLTLGKADKFMIAVRSTSSMEVPVRCSSRSLQVEVNYIKFLCEEANRRLLESLSRLTKLEDSIVKSLKG